MLEYTKQVCGSLHPSHAPKLAHVLFITSTTTQVVMPAFNAFHQNRPAYRIFSLVDDFCTLSAEVKVSSLMSTSQSWISVLFVHAKVLLVFRQLNLTGPADGASRGGR